jgi:MFS family permease
MTEFDSPAMISWLGASFFIATAISQPLCGQLTDVFSRRSGMICGATIFLTGNLMCSLASTGTVLIAGRAVSGLGGGALVVVSTIIISDVVPLEERGHWQGLGNIAYGAGHGLGGIFSGLTNDLLSWRYGFLAMVPVAASIILSSWILLSNLGSGTCNTSDAEEIEEVESWTQRVDFVGGGLLSSGLFCILLGSNLASFNMTWTSPTVISLLVCSALLLGSFAFRELCLVKHPVLPLVLLRHRTIVFVLAINFFGVMAASIAEFYLPLYFELQDTSAAHAGGRLAPLSIGAVTGSYLAGLGT